MPKVGPLSISIVNPITNSPYEEHQVGTKDIHAECHVVSKSGDKFKIHLELDVAAAVTNTYSAHITVDGKPVCKRLIGKVRPTRIFLQSSCSGWDVGPDLCAPFIFGDTQFSEEGLSDKTRLLALGSIMIGVYRVRCRTMGDMQYKRIGEEEIVGEKAKKALLTHSVKYGKPEPQKLGNCWAADYIDPVGKPCQSFTFFYRSRTILEALNIIPPTPASEAELDASTPEISEDDEDEEDDNVNPAERIRQLKAQLRELKVKVKREPEAPPELLDLTQPEAKKRRVVVDLTDE